MDEKIGKLLQNLQSIEGKLKDITGYEEAVSNLLSYIDLHDLEGDLEFRELVSEISARQKGNIRGDRREASLHEYAAKMAITKIHDAYAEKF